MLGEYFQAEINSKRKTRLSVFAGVRKTVDVSLLLTGEYLILPFHCKSSRRVNGLEMNSVSDKLTIYAMMFDDLCIWLKV